MTRSSQPIFPSSTRIASAAAVNALVVEPIWNNVPLSTGSAAPRARTPYPRARVTLPRSTMATDAPGTSEAFMTASTLTSKFFGGAARASAGSANASKAVM
jgi:hypothetical protein